MKPFLTSKKRRWYLLLLLIPVVVLLWPPFYNMYSPQFLGIPYFYWYQMLWIIFTALLLSAMYLLETRK